jgi:hypothetical protein
VSGPVELEPIPVISPIDGAFWTWVVPPLVFAVALLATWALYRRFSSQPPGDDGEDV